MMTCRLLCALLVLALCFCPSVHAGDTQPKAAASSKTATIPASTMSGANGSVTSQLTPSSVTPQEADQLGSSSNGAAAERGNTAGDAGNSPSPHSQSSGAHNTVQREGTEDTTGPISGNNIPTEQTNKKSEASAQTTTTTTTTKAPTTTTTTTEAPSTTTTEAPAVSTTSAPSRLRETDGSLSSSAWVCAPLVLAASALAYTAVG
ncbi:putative mucin TcMUCII [Trypanosoma cruzi]|uniref:Mucin TcMUCII, putative n=2 Tax=Trypanosoma cruzi TaxID=5693 RepID=Q4DV95_TRYCC|nr:mucin TcMUCII, putative [Trypanosoma cruzi]EAN96453.1 mucin TcMUCII, putative [Trypanosoma cruzi]PWV14100.1 putative mucin TcMUCII [Trypanosoma cruzi]RNC33536.1 mucin TcMUCII [Trypanosoma cruzi]|eukprot:XP_818304.1 mucin TcMUCII [Trypanosoma cruzi strain CL Brener]